MGDHREEGRDSEVAFLRVCDSPAAMLTKKPCAAATAVYPTGKEPNSRI